MKAKIRWFDALSGEGLVRAEDGQSYYIHFTAIENVSVNNYQWPDDKDREFLSNLKDKDCEIELYVDPTFTQVEKCIIK